MNNYKSNFERDIGTFLSRRKIKFRYEPYTLKYNTIARTGYCGECGSNNIIVERNYLPDFVVGPIIIEAKGRFTSRDRTKMLSVIECNPDLDIRMFFARDNWLTKARKTRYSEWCQQKGVQFAVGEFPKEWIKELKAYGT